MRHANRFWCLCAAALVLAWLPASRAEIGGTLTTELAGTQLSYEYTSGRRYQVRYGADTLAYLRQDVPGREWVEGVPYVARKLGEGLYYLSWYRPERQEIVSIVLDFNARMLYTSALLEGSDRHFDEARITGLDRSVP